ncbi:hypothetical protein GCM10020255_107090 [Rhodococcus baikonurensis]
MAYVITQPCCNDASCVDVCPVNCIHPTPDEAPFATTEMLYIDPDTCIDCGACVDECPVEAIFPDNELDEDDAPYLQMNASYFEKHPMGPDWPEPITMAKIDPELGTLKVAIVGSGPAACYAAMELTGKPRVEVDMFDRLPTPTDWCAPAWRRTIPEPKASPTSSAPSSRRRLCAATSTSRWAPTSRIRNSWTITTQ